MPSSPTSPPSGASRPAWIRSDFPDCINTRFIWIGYISPLFWTQSACLNFNVSPASTNLLCNQSSTQHYRFDCGIIWVLSIRWSCFVALWQHGQLIFLVFSWEANYTAWERFQIMITLNSCNLKYGLRYIEVGSWCHSYTYLLSLIRSFLWPWSGIPTVSVATPLLASLFTSRWKRSSVLWKTAVCLPRIPLSSSPGLSDTCSR